MPPPPSERAAPAPDGGILKPGVAVERGEKEWSRTFDVRSSRRLVHRYRRLFETAEGGSSYVAIPSVDSFRRPIWSMCFVGRRLAPLVAPLATSLAPFTSPSLPLLSSSRE